MDGTVSAVAVVNVGFIPTIVVLANLISAGRLLCYRRGSSQHWPLMSMLAYLLIVCAGGQAIDIAVNHAPTSAWQAGVSIVVAVLVVRAKGNVSHIIRLTS